MMRPRSIVLALALIVPQPVLAAGAAIFLSTHMVAPPNATTFLQEDAAQGCSLSVPDKARYSLLFMTLNRDAVPLSQFDRMTLPGLAPDQCSANIVAATPTFAGYYLFPYGAVFGGAISPCLQTVQKVGNLSRLPTC